MAYAAILSLAHTIDLILNYHQDFISPLFKDQAVRIHKNVISLQTFVDDFPDKPIIFEGRIREVLHSVEDVIEFLLSEQIHESSVEPSKSQFKHQPKGEYGHRHFDFHYLEIVAKGIESITKEVTGKSEGAMAGFGDDLIIIKDRLCGGSSELEVIPIVGMGGLGKTTLARSICDDPFINEYFHIRAWATVSQDYSLLEIVSSLLVSIRGSDVRVPDDMVKSMEIVYKSLKGRRYLITLDDMWSRRAWDELKRMFPNDGNGSRIMLTTRNSDVAIYSDSSSRVHHMCLMNDDKSWNLLQQKVFKQDPCPAKLEYIGKMIARSCRGLPLAVVVISGILSTIDQTEAAWWNIVEMVNSVSFANDDDWKFDKILFLSYTLLPHHLRPCFLYLGGFPEDYEIRVSKLIKLWVAEGFLKPKEYKSIEDTAEEYLEDLVERSLVLVTKRRSNGRIKSFTIHDVMRDLCISKAWEENFFVHADGFVKEGIMIPRRVSTSPIHTDLGVLGEFFGLSIRTILCGEDFRGGTRWSFRHFRLLKILDLSNADISSNLNLAAEIFELFHLRYLAFGYPFNIPPAISNLKNLQTLIISSSNYDGQFVGLPMEIWRMPQLRHLVVPACVLPNQEGATFALEDLQTLSGAVNFICSMEILKKIPNLKKLGIYFTGRIAAKKDYQLHNLIYLQKLEHLKIEMDIFLEKQQRIDLALPMTLKKLTLSGLRLHWEDMTIVGSLPNLEICSIGSVKVVTSQDSNA